jgi:hypothetical protein
MSEGVQFEVYRPKISRAVPFVCPPSAGRVIGAQTRVSVHRICVYLVPLTVPAHAFALPLLVSDLGVAGTEFCCGISHFT